MGRTMNCAWCANVVEGGGLNGSGNGLLGVLPLDHGLLKLIGTPTGTFEIAVANGGFWFTRCAVKKFGSSYTSAEPARNTVLPCPVGSKVIPTRGENCQGEFCVNASGTPASP